MHDTIIIIGKNVTSLFLAAMLIKANKRVHILDNSQSDFIVDTIKLKNHTISLLRDLLGTDFIEALNRKRILLKLGIQNDGYWHINTIELEVLLEKTLNSLSSSMSNEYSLPFILEIPDELIAFNCANNQAQDNLSFTYHHKTTHLSYNYLIDLSCGLSKSYQKINKALGLNPAVEINHKVFVNKMLLDNSMLFRPCYLLIQLWDINPKLLQLLKDSSCQINNPNQLPPPEAFKAYNWKPHRIPSKQFLLTKKGLFYGAELPLHLYLLPEITSQEHTLKKQKIIDWVGLVLRCHFQNEIVTEIQKILEYHHIKIYRNHINLFLSNPTHVTKNPSGKTIYLNASSKLIAPDIYTGLAEIIPLKKIQTITDIISKKDLTRFDSYSQQMRALQSEMLQIFHLYLYNLDELEFQYQTWIELKNKVIGIYQLYKKNEYQSDIIQHINQCIQYIDKVYFQLSTSRVNTAEFANTLKSTLKLINSLNYSTCNTIWSTIKAFLYPSHTQKILHYCVKFLKNKIKIAEKRHLTSRNILNDDIMHNPFLSHFLDPNKINNLTFLSGQIKPCSSQKILNKLNISYKDAAFKILLNADAQINIDEYLSVYAKAQKIDKNNNLKTERFLSKIQLSLYSLLTSNLGIQTASKRLAAQTIPDNVKYYNQCFEKIKYYIQSQQFSLYKKMLKILNILDIYLCCNYITNCLTSETALLAKMKPHISHSKVTLSHILSYIPKDLSYWEAYSTHLKNLIQISEQNIKAEFIRYINFVHNLDKNKQIEEIALLKQSQPENNTDATYYHSLKFKVLSFYRVSV